MNRDSSEWTTLCAGSASGRDDLHRTVDVGEPIEVGPIPIVNVGVSDQEIAHDGRRPETTFANVSGVFARLSKARNSLL
jgi:hypothetical protein